MLSIRTVTTLEEFETLADPWNALLEQAGSDNVFLTWEWLYTWTKHYLGHRRLWIILVYRGNQLIGIAPFYIRHVASYGLVNLREMRFLGTEEVASSYLDFIVAERNKKAVLRTVYPSLHYGEVRRLWDTLTLSEVPAESSTIDLWDGFNQESGKLMAILHTTPCPVIELTGCPEDFLKRLSPNARYNLRRKRQRLERAGSVVYDRVSSSEDVEKAFGTFIELHRMRWGHEVPGRTFGRPRFLAFHQEIAKLFGQRGWIRLDFLRFNGEAIAAIYGYRYNGRHFFYLPGFNPAVAPHASPGILLLFRSIEEANAEGATQFDLLRGVADYKMAWSNGLRRSVTCRYYNRHFRNTVVRFLESAKDLVKSLVR